VIISWVITLYKRYNTLFTSTSYNIIIATTNTVATIIKNITKRISKTIIATINGVATAYNE